MNVLLVDDSSTISKLVTQMLEDAGHNVVTACDGLDAVKVLKVNNKFDLILLDWNMPEMNGLEFLAFNNENKIVDCPIIMMTTENKPETIMKALSEGAVEYIMKPFTQDILISKMETVIGNIG
jgi:two-component system chemotaxis response regulator CheY